MLLENQKQTQRRRDAKNTQRLFCFSLRDLSDFAVLREGFWFCLMIVFCLAFVVGCSKDSSQKSDAAQSEKASTDSMQSANVDAAKMEEPQTTAEQPRFDAAQRPVAETPKAAPQSSPAMSSGDLAPLDIKLPKPMFVGTPQNFRVDKLEKPLGKPRPPFLAPAGVKNVAFKKSLTSTDKAPIIGEIAMITDGSKEASEGNYVELGPFLQNVTVDLGAKHDIYAIVLWHFHEQPRVYFDVIVQVADDPAFKTNVHTLFNNDLDNSAKLGAGQDLHYVETSEGKLVDAKGVQARYVRFYSNGNTNNDLNHYIEVEVYGKPSAAM